MQGHIICEPQEGPKGPSKKIVRFVSNVNMVSKACVTA